MSYKASSKAVYYSFMVCLLFKKIAALSKYHNSYSIAFVNAVKNKTKNHDKKVSPDIAALLFF